MTAAVVTRNSPNQLELMMWGIKFPWASLINIRADSSAKPWARKLVENNRCIVPIDGFYEWQKQGSEKVPNYIGIEKREWIGLAGVYHSEKDDQGNEVKSFAIMTTEPNELMKKIHDRMPVILFREEEDLWLEPGIKEMSYYENILSPYPDDMMYAYPISKRVNNPANNDERLRLEWKEFKPGSPNKKVLAK
jgi:putative SOS response-associated peptidase YedK